MFAQNPGCDAVPKCIQKVCKKSNPGLLSVSLASPGVRFVSLQHWRTWKCSGDGFSDAWANLLGLVLYHDLRAFA